MQVPSAAAQAARPAAGEADGLLLAWIAGLSQQLSPTKSAPLDPLKEIAALREKRRAARTDAWIAGQQDAVAGSSSPTARSADQAQDAARRHMDRGALRAAAAQARNVFRQAFRDARRDAPAQKPVETVVSSSSKRPQQSRSDAASPAISPSADDPAAGSAHSVPQARGHASPASSASSASGVQTETKSAAASAASTGSNAIAAMAGPLATAAESTRAAIALAPAGHEGGAASASSAAAKPAAPVGSVTPGSGGSTTPIASAGGASSQSRGPQTSATHTTSRAAAPAETADEPSPVAQLVKVLRSRLGDQRSTTTLRLDPPELGTLRLHLDLQREALSLKVETSTELAQRLLSSDLDGLRQALSAAGIRLEHVEVRPAATAPDADRQPQGQPDASFSSGGDAARSDAESSQQSGTRDFPADVSSGALEALHTTGHADAAGSAERPAAESLVNVLA